MNTKQILYNALKSQLDIKDQEYKTFNETVTIPAINEFNNEIKQFLNSLISVNDIRINTSRITIQPTSESGFSRDIDLVLQSSYRDDNKYVDISWSGGTYNLGNKIDCKNFINTLNILSNNLKLIEDKWINDWYSKRSLIEQNDKVKHGEFIELQSALNNLRNEIAGDIKESMMEVGFEISKFKDQYTLDWNYSEANSSKRLYTIQKSPRAISLQHGRSQYDTVYVHGFKILGKKGNKYNIEVFREGYNHVYNYDVLEKKFEAFIDNVYRWENEQADKEKELTEKAYQQRIKQYA